MPIYACGDGKYRIGDGPCMYTSKPAAERAYVAYLAAEESHRESESDHKKADANKVSFDFDDTIEKEEYQAIAKRKISEGKTVYIITRRQESMNAAVYDVAEKVGIPKSRVYFTNGKMKWETIKRLDIGVHYDNNPDELKLIRENTDAEARQAKNITMIYGYKRLQQEVKDVDAKKGIVTGYFSAFNIKDSDGDIIRPGAFQKSINDWFPKGRIKHLLNHDPRQPLGKIMDLKEDAYGLYYESQIGKHNLGQDFIKMVDSDLVKEHSIGFNVIKEHKGDSANELLDIKLFEGSSLTSWGANEYTPLLGMKGHDMHNRIERLKKLEKFVKSTDATDETIELLLLEIKQLNQLIEDMSSARAVVEAPVEQPKAEDDKVKQAIQLLIHKHF